MRFLEFLSGNKLILIFSTVAVSIYILHAVQEHKDNIRNDVYETGICEIHDSKMAVEKVAIAYGLPMNYWLDYKMTIESKLFPNSDDPLYSGGCIVEEIYFKRYVSKIVITIGIYG